MSEGADVTVTGKGINPVRCYINLAYSGRNLISLNSKYNLASGLTADINTLEMRNIN